MKKIGTLNSDISAVLSKLGHTDTIVIADCGLPVPDGVQRIDLALKRGTPGLIETLETVLSEMEVEKYVLANEIREKNPEMKKKIVELMPGVECAYLSHEDFKKATAQAKAIIRTGEDTPYANVILQSGVIF
ncbi:D-ribose pyranase [Aneurinibacillus terranovensis]|uniref:D-ribose pyranase n=1 Tax=Aneurinibacillus terranovensis TaxID=278991 RepID=UPI0003FE6356|nr:D-ribose pyranase [Aneurinibacillus terranovensis]